MTILLQITIQQVTSHGRALLEALQPRYYTKEEYLAQVPRGSRVRAAVV